MFLFWEKGQWREHVLYYIQYQWCLHDNERHARMSMRGHTCLTEMHMLICVHKHIIICPDSRLKSPPHNVLCFHIWNIWLIMLMFCKCYFTQGFQLYVYLLHFDFTANTSNTMKFSRALRNTCFKNALGTRLKLSFTQTLQSSSFF